MWEIAAEYSYAEGMEKLLKQYGVEIKNTAYAEKVRFLVQAKTCETEKLRGAISDFLCGKEEIRLLEKKDGYFPVRRL